jgi:amidohydrolase
LFDRIREEIIDLRQEMIDLRRDFHQHPELGMEEKRTAGVVANRLKGLGLKVRTEIGKTGVVGLLEGRGQGKTLLLRADMDALPIQEESNIPYCSRNKNLMHACGHDGHMAILLTVAQVLSAHRRDFPGFVKFVFQPGEEGFGGAHLMIEDGVLKDPLVNAALALHLITRLPFGILGLREGPTMACMDDFTVDIKGKGGHAANPEDGVDAIGMSAQVISALQSLISREVSPLTPLVVHVGTIHGGRGFNIIADKVQLKGTVRTHDETLRRSMPERINRIVKGVTAALRGTHELNYRFGYPPVINDSVMNKLVADAAAKVVSLKSTVQMPPVMASDDMAFFLKEVPGSYFFVGAANAEKGLDKPLHHSMFDFDEEALVIGAETMARAALTYLIDGC